MPYSSADSKFRSPARVFLALVVAAALSSAAQAAPRWVPIGPSGGVVNQLAQASSDPLRLYAATYPSGLFRSRDGGLSWQSVSRGFEGLEVRKIGVDPRNPDAVLADVEGGEPFFQVWRSADGGTTWAPSPKPPQGAGFFRESYDFSFDAGSSQTVYAATSNAIFRSLDGGSTWDLWALPDLQVFAIAQDPDAPAVRYASVRTYTGMPGGVFKSTDGGATWSAAPSAGGPSDPINLPTRLFFHAGAFYAVWNGALYRSTDGATSWSLAAHLATVGGASDFRFSASGKIFAATYTGVYSSTDGVVWSPAETTVIDQGSPGDSINGLALLAGDKVVAVGRRGAWRSTDGGSTWRAASRGLAVRAVGSLVVVPNPQGTVIGSFEEGLYRTDRGESTWQRLPRQLGFEAPVLAPDPQHPGRVYALGTEDVGISEDQGKTWRRVGGLHHDFAYLLRVDPFHPNVLYAGVELGGGSSANGFGYRSTDGGATWTEILSFDYLLDVAFDAAHRNVVYRATFSGVDKSIDGGATWTALPNVRSQISFASPSALLYEPRTRALYLGTDERGVFRSTDGGQTFHRLVGGLPRLPGGKNPAVGSLILDAAGTLYAGLRQAGVFRLVPGHGWTAINAGLPLLTFNGQLIADPARAGLLYAPTFGSSVLRLESP